MKFYLGDRVNDWILWGVWIGGVVFIGVSITSPRLTPQAVQCEAV